MKCLEQNSLEGSEEIVAALETAAMGRSSEHGDRCLSMPATARCHSTRWHLTPWRDGPGKATHSEGREAGHGRPVPRELRRVTTTDGGNADFKGVWLWY